MITCNDVTILPVFKMWNPLFSHSLYRNVKCSDVDWTDGIYVNWFCFEVKWSEVELSEVSYDEVLEDKYIKVTVLYVAVLLLCYFYYYVMCSLLA
jgi:hypothetical protein